MTNKLPYINPLLIAAAPVLFLWNHNFAEVFMWEVFPSLVVLLVFAVATFGVFWVLYRDPHKASFLASVTLVLALFYQYIFFNALIEGVMRHRWAFIIILLLIAALAYAVKRSQSAMVGATKILTMVAGVFVLFSSLQLIGNYASASIQGRISPQGSVVEADVKEPRDIYYIIFDEYTAPEVFSEVLGFKGINDTVDFLEEQGFFVAKESRSNYSGTHLSLPSSLNLRYVDDYLEDGTKPLRVLTNMTLDNFLKDFLKARGYRYIHLGADWTDFWNPYADENINIGFFSPFQMLLLRSTVFQPIGEALEGRSPLGVQLGIQAEFLDYRRTQWRRTQYQLEELGKIPERNKGPVFVFAHLLLPHEPYVFDEEGNYVTKEGSDAKLQRENYLAQAAYTGAQIEILVEKLLSRSKRAPIIILQGDHGHKFPLYEPERLQQEYGLKPDDMPDLMVRIFNAYYLPDGGDALLYGSITPVNSFRVVLNYYFDQKLELLEDKSYTFDPNDSAHFMLLP